MKPTIKNKLVGGFAGLLLVIVGVACIGAFSVFSLRRSAFETTRVGDRLNSESLEVQVHTLQAHSLARAYLNGIKTMGAQQAKDTYLDEAEFEVNEIQNLAANLVKIAPTEARARQVCPNCHGSGCLHEGSEQRCASRQQQRRGRHRKNRWTRTRRPLRV